MSKATQELNLPPNEKADIVTFKCEDWDENGAPVGPVHWQADPDPTLHPVSRTTLDGKVGLTFVTWYPVAQAKKIAARLGAVFAEA